MDLAVTVGAAPVKEKLRSASPRRARMAVVYMTRGAHPGIRHFKEPVVIRAVGIVAVAAIFHDRNMLPHERTSPLCVAGVAVLIQTRLLEHDRVGGAVRIVAVATGDLSLPQRHVRGALERGFSLQVALAANLGLSALVKKGRLVIDLGKLEAVGGLLHDRMTADATDSTSGMRTRLPICLHPALMALEAAFVLDASRLSRTFAEADQSPDALPPSFSHVLAPRPMAGLAGLLLQITAGIGQENLPHHGLGKFFDLSCVAGFADGIARVSGFLSRLSLC